MDHSKSDKDIKLVWCSPHPNHYNGYLFDHLAILPDVNFEAVYFAEKLIHYPWTSSVKADYPVHYLKKKGGVDFGFLWRKLKAKKELLIIAGWNEPTMMLLLLLLIATRRKFIIVTDTPRLRSTTNVKEYLRKVYLNLIFNNAYKFLVTGKPGIERAKLLGIKESIVINFPFATNTDFFTPLKEQKHSVDNPLLFLSSGRLDNAHKGYDFSIRALHQLKQTHPYLSFRYWIAGDGPDKELLEKMIHTYDMSEEVQLKGWLELHDLLPFYHSGDVFLHPSHEDPFPNAVLEAMACGLPVIGSEAAGSVMDRVVNDKNGYSHQDGNVEELYQKILQVISLSGEQLKAMSLSARETALQWTVTYHQDVMQHIIQEYSQKP